MKNTPEQNKTLVLKAFDTLFNKRDYEAAARFWSDTLFFLIFGTLLLRLFGVPLSMVRIVGGIILMKIGFELFRNPRLAEG
jgi:small neutral amino acid transporter SnatA (MarC family)